MIADFKIDDKLENDSFHIVNLELCQVRLINNSDYIWLILVPQQNNIVEITDLPPPKYNLFCSEIHLVSQIMQKLFKPDKLNIATIGNIVRQLHVHIIARFKNDKLFPKPVWGCEFTPYDPAVLSYKISIISDAIKNLN